MKKVDPWLEEIKVQQSKAIKSVALKGGSGSGNFGHEGRPGLVGGSGEGGASSDESEDRKGTDKKQVFSIGTKVKNTSRSDKFHQGLTGTVVGNARGNVLLVKYDRLGGKPTEVLRFDLQIVEDEE